MIYADYGGRNVNDDISIDYLFRVHYLLHALTHWTNILKHSYHLPIFTLGTTTEPALYTYSQNNLGMIPTHT